MAREVKPLTDDDRAAILEVVNAAAERYSGVIPTEADTDPYMSMTELVEEMAEVEFLGIRQNRLVGVIGLQERDGVSLIRHLYVRPSHQRRGIGRTLLSSGIDRAAAGTVLVGTWAAADWAIEFYEANGFENLGCASDLLARYWDVPEHQRKESVVLRYVG